MSRIRVSGIIMWTFVFFISAFALTAWAEIEPAMVQFSGRVLDGAGNPVAGAEVYVYKNQQVKRPADFSSNRTEQDGRFRLSLPAGRYWAVAVWRKGGSRFGPLSPEDRHSGEPILLDIVDPAGKIMDFIVLDLREAFRQGQKKNEALVRVQGKIQTDQGEPVSMAYVMADVRKQPKGIPLYLSAWTSSDGLFSIYLPPGRYFLGAFRQFPPPEDLSLSKEMDIAHDQEGLELLLSP